MEFCPVQNSRYVLGLRSPILAALLMARQPNFAAWYMEWNYGTLKFGGSFAEGATYIRLGSHHVISNFLQSF